MSSSGDKREKRQQRVFTKWCNSHLKKRDLKIKSVLTGFHNGVNLCHLYEIISHEKLPKFEQNPRKKMNEFLKVVTLQVVLSKVNAFVKEIGIGLSYDAFQVCHGDKTTILGMIWVLISKFIIPESQEENTSAKKALLKWCQKVLSDEKYANTEVKNFSTSFANGLNFCALLHQFDNTLLDYTKLTKDNQKENCQLAFKIAKEKLGIDNLLDVEDVVNDEKPDEKLIMTYIATYYHKFKDLYKEKLTRKEEEYEKGTKELLDWIETASSKFNAKEFECDVDSAFVLLDQYDNFLMEEKSKKANEKQILNLKLAKLQREQKQRRLKIYEPSEGNDLISIEKKWNELSEKVANYGKAIKQYISKFIDGQDKIINEYDELANEFIALTAKLQKDVSNKETESLKTTGENSKMHQEFADLKDKVLSEINQSYQNLIQKYQELEEYGIESRVITQKDQITRVKEVFEFSICGLVSGGLLRLQGFPK